MRTVLLGSAARRRVTGGPPADVEFDSASAMDFFFESAAPIQTASWTVGGGSNRYLFGFGSGLDFGTQRAPSEMRHQGSGGTPMIPLIPQTMSQVNIVAIRAFGLANPASGAGTTWADFDPEIQQESIIGVSYENVGVVGLPVISRYVQGDATTSLIIDATVPTPNTGDRVVFYAACNSSTGSPVSAAIAPATEIGDGHLDGFDVFSANLSESARTGQMTTVRIEFSGANDFYDIVAVAIPLYTTQPYQLLDLFTTTTRSSFWEVSTSYLGFLFFETAGGTATQANGLLSITPTDAANRVAGISSNTINLTDTYAQVQVVTTATVSSEFNFIVADPSDAVGGASKFVSWTISRNSGGVMTLRAIVNRTGAAGTEWSATWDPAEHSCLRIRDSGGDIFWETSSSVNGPWIVRRRLSVDASPVTYIPFNAAKVGLFVHNTGSSTGATWVVDNAIVPTKQLAHQLYDTFKGPRRDLKNWDELTLPPSWNSVTIGGTFTYTGSQVTITPTASADSAQGLESQSDQITLVGQRFVVRLMGAPSTTSSAEFGYSDTADVGVNARWEVSNNLGVLSIIALWGNYGDNGTPYEATYNATDHAWFSIRATGSDIFWETAPDNSGAPGAWTIRRQLTVDGGTPGVYAAPDAGKVGIYARNWNSNATPINIGFGEAYVTPV